MSPADLTLQEAHLARLRELTARDDGAEAAAYILCGEARIEHDPWERRSRRRFTSYEVIAVPPEDRISASDRHVTWSTNSFVRLLRRSKNDALVLGIVHTHPKGPKAFSEQDDRNERDLMQLARNRNGDGAVLLSVLLTGSGEIRARYWPDLLTPIDATTTRIVGRRLAFHPVEASALDLDAFSRQMLAFGAGVTRSLRQMKVGVVGCGGTGSPTAMLLARLGVGQIALFDDDIVEVSNLNRLHGAKRVDADAMRPKVDVLAREIADLGLGVRAVPFRGWVGDPMNRDALRSCDVIFGCTDDHDGRLFLNRFAYFYLTPVIDMGLAIEPALDSSQLRDLTGRVTVLGSGAPCLACRGVVDPVAARDEDLQRRNPEEFARRKREAYVRGGGNPAPAVVTFTTATACLAVDELLQGLTGFRGEEGWAWQRTRRFDRLEDRRPGAKQNPHCAVCSETSYWGRGDVEPFLDRTG